MILQPPELYLRQMGGYDFKGIYGSEWVEVGEKIITLYMEGLIKEARERTQHA